MGVKPIVRKLGVARNTVRAALRSDEAPKYEREDRGSAVDEFEPAIRRLLAVTPDMPATVVAERIGWARGMTVLRERVAELRPAFQDPQVFGRSASKTSCAIAPGTARDHRRSRLHPVPKARSPTCSSSWCHPVTNGPA